MFKGVAFALGACFIWGLIFIVPQFMTGFSAIEVALGRYLFYGAISLLIFCKGLLQKGFRYPKSIWFKAFYFSLFSTIGYYTCVVLALRCASPSVCALILGISPITIAFYGNWRQKETSFRSLILPSILIVIGLVIINVPHLETTLSPTSYVLGLLFSFLALTSWSWYVVANSRFLRYHSHVHPSDWSTMIGVTAFCWALLWGTLLTLLCENQIQIPKYCIMSKDLERFLIGGAILGLLCSWVGAFLWNKASLRLPVSLAGQLTIFETIFGVLFVYIVNQSLPSLMEGIGIAILLAAIVYGIRIFAKRKSDADKISPH